MCRECGLSEVEALVLDCLHMGVVKAPLCNLKE
jgi:hypothetical protein